MDSNSEPRAVGAEGTKRRTGGRSARVRDAVLGAVLTQLLEGGYGQLNYREVALAAGVAETTIYRRWPTKPELARAAIAEMAATESPVPDTGSLESDLHALMGQVLDMLRQPNVERLVRTAAALDNDGPSGEAKRAFWSSRFAGASSIVVRAIDRGELPPGTNSEEMIELLVAPLYLRLLLTGLPLDDEIADESIRRAIRAFSR